ncbi:MAG: RNA methyltransferase, partial [Terriglobus roseus]|nr:RNA methyltransferase [Terriglobus roseus]
MRLPPPIISRTNAKVKALRASLSGEARRPGDLLGLEGEHLIQEAHQAGMSFEAVYVREGSEAVLEERSFYRDLRTREWLLLSAAVFDTTVSTVNPQGVAATWSITEPVRPDEPAPVTLLVENLQDPGNLGTLIRTVAAFGMGRVVVTPGTVNQWNPKVVRSAAGALFRVPVERRALREAVAHLHSRQVRVFAAVASFADGADLGGRAELLPHNGVLTGSRRPQDVPGIERYDEVLAPEGSKRFPASFSYDTDFELPCAIIIGNEGAGLSPEARMLADEQVSIPGVNESMNAAVAGS